jgi:hypothetical protein
MIVCAHQTHQMRIEHVLRHNPLPLASASPSAAAPGGGAVCFAAFSADDRLLLTVAEPAAVRVWRVASGECVLALHNAHSEVVTAAAWMSGGGSSGSEQHMQGLKPVKDEKEHGAAAAAAGASAGGAHTQAYTFVTAGIDKKIVCWVCMSAAALQQPMLHVSARLTHSRLVRVHWMWG